ncbi:MAG: hypothetical protein M0Q01_05985 [Syntrophales bacterium]|nr:hypothetical protein [Syntrophales bacterium]
MKDLTLRKNGRLKTVGRALTGPVAGHEHGGFIMNEPDGNPEARVALFQKREIRRTMQNNEWWFVITDIIAALTDSADPSDYWKKMRKRDPDLGELHGKGGDNLSPPLPWSSQRPAERARTLKHRPGSRSSRAGTLRDCPPGNRKN